MEDGKIDINGTVYKLVSINSLGRNARDNACFMCVANNNERLCNALCPHCGLTEVFRKVT